LIVGNGPLFERIKAIDTLIFRQILRAEKGVEGVKSPFCRETGKIHKNLWLSTVDEALSIR
jgi:hypothetical protein